MARILVSSLRIVVAALLLSGSIVGSAAARDTGIECRPQPWWSAFAPLLAGLGAILMIALMSRFSKAAKGPSPEETLASLDGAGLVERQSFRATRAFEVEEYEDEGRHYFIELSDGRVLYLEGQYLYDYEPIDDADQEIAQARSFPCTEFEILRHKEKGYVLDIVRGGTVLEPEPSATPFTMAENCASLLEDGDIVPARSYDMLKFERFAYKDPR